MTVRYLCLPVSSAHYDLFALAALMVQFDPATYSVTEGEEVVFMIILSGPADRDVTVEFMTMDDSARGNYYHYQN